MNDLSEVNFKEFAADNIDVPVGPFLITFLRFEDDCLEDMKITPALQKRYGQSALCISLPEHNDAVGHRHRLTEIFENMPKLGDVRYYINDFNANDSNEPAIYAYGDIHAVLSSWVQNKIISADEAVPLFESIEAEVLHLTGDSARDRAEPAPLNLSEGPYN